MQKEQDSRTQNRMAVIHMGIQLIVMKFEVIRNVQFTLHLSPGISKIRSVDFKQPKISHLGKGFSGKVHLL